MKNCVGPECKESTTVSSEINVLQVGKIDNLTGKKDFPYSNKEAIYGYHRSQIGYDLSSIRYA